MPAVSKKQRRAMAIAEHDPGALHAENKGLAKISHAQLHDFSKTKEKGLPIKVKAHGRHKAQRKEPKPRLKYE